MAPQTNDPLSITTGETGTDEAPEDNVGEFGETSTPLEVAEEFDSQERPCILYMYCRPVENTWLNRQQSDTSREIPLHLQHWALVAHFPRGNRYMLFEATENETTKLIQATVSHLLWKQETGVTTQKLAKITTSPKRLLDLARSHPLNNTVYSVTLNNCQEWFKVFYKIAQDDSADHAGDDNAIHDNVVTFLDNAVAGSGRVGGMIVAGFWDVVKRLTGGLFSGSVRVSGSTNPSSSSIRPSYSLNKNH